MTIKEFAKEVQAMRNLQLRQKYTLSPIVDNMLKDQEKRVDTLLQEIANMNIPLYKQQELFD